MSDARFEKGDVPVISFATNGEDMSDTMLRGLECHRRGELAEAEECYRRALAADPEQSDALHLLGLVAHATGKPSAAVDLIEKAIARSPRQPIYHNSLGNALLSLLRPGDASAAFGRALDLRPDFAECHNNLGLALSAQGRIADALASYERALKLKPGYPDFLVNQGNTYMMLGDTVRSEKAYRDAIRSDPDQIAARVNLCKLLLEARRFEEAAAEADIAISRGYESPGLYCAKGRALLAAERPLRAAAQFRHALAIDHNFEEARLGLNAALESQPGDSAYHAALVAARRRGDLKISIDVKGLRTMGSPVPIEYLANLEFLALIGAGSIAFWLVRWEIASAISAALLVLHYTVGEKWIKNLMSRRAMNLIERDCSLWVKCWAMGVVSLARPGDLNSFRSPEGWHLLAEDIEVAHRRKARSQG